MFIAINELYCQKEKITSSRKIYLLTSIHE